MRPLFTGLAATQHSMTNPVVTIDGDTASCRMYMQAHHVFEPEKEDSWFTIGGYYDDTLLRDAKFEFNRVKLTVLWRKGRIIMQLARSEGHRLLNS